MLARKNIPNLLTLARVAAVPLCLAIMLLDPACKAIALFWIFVAASLTDFLDGYLARTWNVVSPLGALLDPIADKLLVALMLVYLLVASDFAVRELTTSDSPLLLPVIVILLRELYISGLREFLASRQIKLPVSKSGKWKTALQMVAIALLLAVSWPEKHALNASDRVEDVVSLGPTFLLGFVLLCLAALLALTSAIAYTCTNWKHLRASK